jgi:RecA/RadA recombinase
VGGVFINYRSKDRPEAAGAIYGELVKRFGRDRVFRDCDSIQVGDRYPAALRSALADADVLVAVIGPGWLATDASGTRLIDRDHDWVRNEIAEAFRIGIPVVPVLLADAARLTREELPDDIRRLALVQALSFNHRRLGEDLNRLVARVTELAASLGISRLFVREPPPLRAAECAPSALLRPEYGLVEFAGRERELELLRAWAGGSQPRSVTFVVGPIGSGKTRLAMVLCAELTEAGWVTGFLARDAPDDDVAHAGRVGTPLLVVVEDVGFQLDRLAALASAVADSVTPVRILLLGRGTGGWLRALRDHPDRRVSELFQTVTLSTGIYLGPATPDTGEQFARADRAFARALKCPEPIGRQFYSGSMLGIHAAALAGVLRSAGGKDVDSGALIIRAVVAADRRRFRSATRSRGRPDLATVHLATVATVATLCRPASGAQATVLRNQLPAFLGADGHRADEYAAAFADLYPGRFWLDAVRPAPIGDYIVAATIASRPDILTTLAAVGDDEQLTNALAVLGTCAQWYPETGQAIVELFQTGPDRIGLLCADAVVRVDEPDALAGWLGTGICRNSISVDGFIAVIERLRHRVPDSAGQAFAREAAMEMAKNLRGHPPGFVKVAFAQLVREMMDNRITADQMRGGNSIEDLTPWMLGFVARLVRDVMLSKALSATERLDRLMRWLPRGHRR